MGWSEDGGQIKMEKDIYYHSPKHIPMICHIPGQPSFSILITFKSACAENDNFTL
jgi:hypothetical protein